MLDDEYLDEVEARCEAALEGPWKADLDVFEEGEPIEACVSDDNILMLFTDSTAVWGSEREPWKTAEQSGAYKNALFIAHAREDVPRLVAEIRMLKAYLKEETVGNR